MSEYIPRIGLTTLFHERSGNAGNWFVRPDKYDEAVVDAGGLPISIPAFVPEKMLESLAEVSRTIGEITERTGKTKADVLT